MKVGAEWMDPMHQLSLVAPVVEVRPAAHPEGRNERKVKPRRAMLPVGHRLQRPLAYQLNMSLCYRGGQPKDLGDGGAQGWVLHDAKL